MKKGKAVFVEIKSKKPIVFIEEGKTKLTSKKYGVFVKEIIKLIKQYIKAVEKKKKKARK